MDEIIVAVNAAGSWPLKFKNCDEFNMVNDETVKAVVLSGNALLVAHMEFVGLPMPKYINEFDSVTWYWGDAAFIVANLKAAYEVNKDATRRK